MRIASLVRFISVPAVSIFSVEAAFACQCGGGFREKNAWENAKRAEQSAMVIFEGTPAKFEPRWDLLDAKEGELITTDALLGPSSTERIPYMVVTFHVAKTYKGDLGPEVQLHTGLGGGDCAAVYTPGLSYLVYASGPNMDHLGASMCSPGGWLEGTEVATDLRYLRKQRPTSKDSAPIKGWSEVDFVKEEAIRKREYEDRRKRFDAATGKICGTLVHDDSKDKGKGSIAFLSKLGYSPILSDYAERKEDGSFCSRKLGPGKYYLILCSETSAVHRHCTTQASRRLQKPLQSKFAPESSSRTSFSTSEGKPPIPFAGSFLPRTDRPLIQSWCRLRSD